MLCCLLGALMVGNIGLAGRLSWRLATRLGPAAALALLGLGAFSLAIAPAVAEHASRYAARARDHHRSVFEEILAQPLCSGEVRQ